MMITNKSLLPYIHEIKILKTQTGIYNLPYLKYTFDNSGRLIDSKVNCSSIFLTKSHTKEELELKFTELILQNHKELLLAIMEGVDNGRSYYNVIQNDYPWVNDGADALGIRSFTTRLNQWLYYLKGKRQITFDKIVVSYDLYKILEFRSYNTDLNISFNKNIPKSKIIFLSSQIDTGCPCYITDGELNDIIIENEDTYAVVDLLSLIDVRDQKINKIFGED